MSPFLQKLIVAKVTVVLYLFRFVIDLVVTRRKGIKKLLDRLKHVSLDFCFIGLSLFVVAVVNPKSSYHVMYTGDQWERTVVYLVGYLVFHMIARTLTEVAGEFERKLSIGKLTVRLTVVAIHVLLIFMAGVMFITGALSVWTGKDAL